MQNKKLRLLFVASRFPHFSRHGDALRAYWFLRHIKKSYRVTVVAPVRRNELSVAAEMMKDLCDEFVLVPTGILPVSANVFRSSALFMPLQVLYFCPARLAAAVKKIVKAERFDLAHIQLARMGPVLDVLGQIPSIIDFVDALSLNMFRRAAREVWPKKWLFDMEGRRMAHYERKLIRRTRLQLVNSPVDKEALGNDDTIHVVPNGVAIENYSYREARRSNNDIVLSGNMNYFPNVDAAVFFAKEVFPLVRTKLPSARFQIVGANPTKEVLKLRNVPGVVVIGTVPDLRPYIQNACVAVSPGLAGNGMQLKILEAMALGTPVVATSKALGGTLVEHEKHLLIAETGEDFARQVVRMLLNHAMALRISREARKLVVENFNWERSSKLVASLYQKALGL